MVDPAVVYRMLHGFLNENPQAPGVTIVPQSCVAKAPTFLLVVKACYITARAVGAVAEGSAPKAAGLYERHLLDRSCPFKKCIGLVLGQRC